MALFRIDSDCDVTGDLAVVGDFTLGIIGVDQPQILIASLDSPWGIGTNHIIDVNGFRDDVLTFGYNVRGGAQDFDPTDLAWFMQFERGWAQVLGGPTHSEFWFGYHPPNSAEEYRIFGCTFNQDALTGWFDIGGQVTFRASGPNSALGATWFSNSADGLEPTWFQPQYHRGNNTPTLYGRNAADDNYLPMIGYDDSNAVVIGRLPSAVAAGAAIKASGSLTLDDGSNPLTGSAAIWSATHAWVLSSGTTRGLAAVNTTAATAGVQAQNSPSIELEGQGWNGAPHSAISQLSNRVIPGNPVRTWLQLHERINGGAEGTALWAVVGGANPVHYIFGTQFLQYITTATLTLGAAATKVRWLGPAQMPTAILPPALAAGRTDNWNPTNLSQARFVFVAADAANSQLSGIAAMDNGTEIWICNSAAAGNLVLEDEEGTSSAANRFQCADNADVTVRPGGSALIRYVTDGALNRWLVMGA